MSVAVQCGAFGCPRAGSVLVTAYACPLPGDAPGPLADDTPVLSALVTTPLRRGTVLGFRFYPHGENYLSAAASAVTFAIGADVPAGTALTLRTTPPSYAYAGMLLLSRARGAASSALLGATGSRPVLAVHSSVFVYWAPRYSHVEPISALGVLSAAGAPVLPPSSVLPCKYAITTLDPGGGAGDAAGQFVYSTATAVPGAWTHAWQVLKWGVEAQWATAPIADYSADVEAVEDARHVQLQPGQLVAIAYKPYEFDVAPAFPGQLVLVVTREVAPGTVARVRGGPWDDSGAAHWVWTAPPTCALLPGTVIDMGGLRPSMLPTVNIGSIAPGDAVPEITDSFLEFTVFSDDGAVTGVYPCSYFGAVPSQLVPGVSILATPWPDCASILSVPCCCSRVASWECFVLQLQRACPTRWLCQPLPSFSDAPPQAMTYASSGTCACSGA